MVVRCLCILILALFTLVTTLNIGLTAFQRIRTSVRLKDLDSIVHVSEAISASIPTTSTPTRTRPKRKIEKERTVKEKGKPEKGFVVKEMRSIADEIEEYFNEDNYLVILYNDPFNKRAYVSSVLQEVFKWDDIQADAVMLQAHTYGYAVAVETSKVKAEKYVKDLLEKGLIAEARKNGDTGDDGGGSAE